MDIYQALILLDSDLLFLLLPCDRVYWSPYHPAPGQDIVGPLTTLTTVAGTAAPTLTIAEDRLPPDLVPLRAPLREEEHAQRLHLPALLAQPATPHHQ